MLRLIALLAAGVPAIVSSLLAFMARKLGTAAGSVVAWVALTVVFIACERSLFDSIWALVNPPAWVASFIGWFMPGDFVTCLGAVVSAKICRASYDLARDKLTLINNAS